MKNPTANHTTLAVVGQKLEHLTQMVKEQIERAKEDHLDHENRLRVIEMHALPEMGTRVTELAERQKTATRAQTIYASIVSLISGAIAAAFGRAP